MIFQALEPLQPQWPQQPQQPQWPQWPYSLISSKYLLILMVGSLPAPKWPIPISFCGMDYQKPNFSLVSDTLSVGGCWGQPMLFFWKLADETQMVKPPEPTSHHNARKYLTLLPLRAIYFRSLYYEISCSFLPWLFSALK